MQTLLTTDFPLNSRFMYFVKFYIFKIPWFLKPSAFHIESLVFLKIPSIIVTTTISSLNISQNIISTEKKNFGIWIRIMGHHVKEPSILQQILTRLDHGTNLLALTKIHVFCLFFRRFSWFKLYTNKADLI